MIRTTILSISLFAAAGACLAQAPMPSSAPRPKLDANGDGLIDRSEAAAMPKLAERFAQLDRNGDGRLDASERPLRDGHKGRDGRKGHDGKGGIAKLDSNGDGQLSRQEAAGKPRLMSDFNAIDTDRNGLLSRQELKAWMQQHRGEGGKGERGERFAQKFAAADTDRDGRLSRSEVARSMPKMQQQFAGRDTNGDGYLSREELRSGGRR